MKVQRVEIEGFMRHERTVVALPDTGVILVTGGNGSGKSAIVEAVYWAAWGKTLRGTDPATAPAVRVRLVTDEVAVERARKGQGAAKVAFVRAGNGEEERGSTATKATAALSTIIGDPGVWAHSSVFSSEDAGRFSRATDAERKKLLEAVLGLDRFDGALKACRADLRAAQTKHTEAANAVAVWVTRAEGAATREKDATAALAELGEDASVDPAVTEKLAELRGLLQGVEADLADAKAALRTAENGAGVRKVEAALAEANARKKRLDAGTCPTCAQAIPATLAAHLAHEVATLRAEATKLTAQAEAAKEGAAADVEEMQEQRNDLVTAVNRLQERVNAATRSAGLRTRLEDQLRRAQADRFTAEATADKAKQDAQALAREVATLGAVERVLGLRGVRAQVVARALGALEAAANAWLSRIVGGAVHLRLTASATSAAGDPTEKIGLEIDGIAGGKGYAAASTGQRRRIDVALLLALSEVASAGAGRSPGTLFADEVFDNLDPEGVARVAEALTAMAKERAVVVITHSDALRSALPDARLLRVRDGGATWER